MAGLAARFLSGNAEGKKNIEEKQEGPSREKYRIMFVDDEENVLKAMARIFRRENYEILTASSGVECLELLKGQPVHVIISDYRMPGMHGAELLQKIKELYPQTIRIMLTGCGDVNAIMGAVNEGAVYKFITKPWNDDDLRITVSLALEQYDLIRENKELKKQHQVQEKKIKNLSRMLDVSRSQIGRMLVKKGLLNEKDLDRAIAEQKQSKKILPMILIEMGFITEKELMKVIKMELNIDVVSPREFSVPQSICALIPREVCEKNVLVPLRQADRKFIVAMADPTDFMKVDDLKFLTGIPVQPVLAGSKEIFDKIRELYQEEELMDTSMSMLEAMDPTENIEVIIEEEDESIDIKDLLNSKDQPPAIRIVNAIVSDALRHKASDVHIEPKSKYLMVRYRIDGLLQDKLHIPLFMHQLIVSRIKIMSELDISERRKPQDGRVTIKGATRMVDMRISTLPTINGEKVVLRILDKDAAVKDIGSLGFNDRDLHRVKRFISRPQGMVLTTGPTGSGKTSTLYSLLQEGATISKNFTTIEEPVEYYMNMAEQVNIRPKIGLDFPVTLRSILRQDPDVILLGEIRDFETAEVAFHAALTGHLVLSTLHTNGTVATITRLKDMGIKPYVISEALIGIVSQRLVRRICRYCIADDNPSEELLEMIRFDRERSDFNPKKGVGCDHCNGTGYSGRVGIFEIFQMDDALKKLIHGDATEAELMRTAVMSGMATTLDDAMQKVRTGETTCEEVLRVLGPQNVTGVQCPHCGVRLEERADYCPMCGKNIIPHCAQCGKIIGAEWKACSYCGRMIGR
jgi:type II secretory ATPase GspE/PulE/Tfp pilus assembly ATPase PilB-like protein/FixJ family two-component response regulator